MSSGLCCAPLVDIRLNEVFIAPGKSDGTAWDGLGGGPERALVDALLRLAGTSVGAQLLRQLNAKYGEAAFNALAKPDPYGQVELVVPWDADTTISLRAIQDTFVAEWRDVGWSEVPLFDGVDIRLRVTLWDEDLSNDDVIGTVEVNAAELAAAMREGSGYAVGVADQGARQIVAVVVSVNLVDVYCGE